MTDHPHVESFGTMEEMFAVMGAREDAANAALSPEAHALRDDTTHERHWLRLYPEFGGSILPIFGRTYSLPEAMAIERGYYPDPIDAEGLAEYAYIVESLHDRRARGYLYGRCYSVVEPEGEIGDTHVASVLALTPEAFAEAEAGGWDLAALDTDGLVWTAIRAAATRG